MMKPMLSAGLCLLLVGCGGGSSGTASAGAGGSTNTGLTQPGPVQNAIRAKGVVPVGTPGVVVYQPPANPLEFALRLISLPAHAQSVNLAGYKVLLHNALLQPEAEATADSAGVATFRNILVGNYRLTFVHPTADSPVKVEAVAFVSDRVSLDRTANAYSTALTFVALEVVKRMGAGGFASLDLAALEQQVASGADFVALVAQIETMLTSAQPYLDPASGEPTTVDLQTRAHNLAAGLDLSKLRMPLVSTTPVGPIGNASNSQFHLTLTGDANFDLIPFTSDGDTGVDGQFVPQSQAATGVTTSVFLFEGGANRTGFRGLQINLLRGVPLEVGMVIPASGNNYQFQVRFTRSQPAPNGSLPYIQGTSGSMTITSLTAGPSHSGTIGLEFNNLHMVPDTSIPSTTASGSFVLNGPMTLNLPLGL